MFRQDIVPPIAQFTEIEIGGSVFVFSRETAEKIVHIALNAWQESCWPVKLFTWRIEIIRKGRSVTNLKNKFGALHS